MAAAVLGAGAPAEQSADARKWLEDLDALARELPRRHVAPETERPLAAFAADVQRLRALLPTMSREEIVLELARLAASFGDSHTELSLAQAAVGFHRVPVSFYFFGEDLRVIAADPAHAGLLGLRLVAIGERPVADVLERIRPLLGDDHGNPYEILHSGPALLAIPEVLFGLGLAAPAGPIPYVFEADDGERVSNSFAPLPFGEAAAAMTARVLSSDSRSLFARDRHRWYLLAPAGSADALYVRIDRSQDQDGAESLAALAKRVAAAIGSAGSKRVVVDLRRNTGGNFHKTEPLVDAVCGAAGGRDVSQVFVLLGRHTYSAAIVLAAQLKHGCDARFVGEIPRAVPNRQADVESFRLPNSKLEITYAARLRRPFPELGDGTMIPLDLAAPWTWESYRTGRDPALEAALTQPDRPIRRDRSDRGS